MSGLTHGDKKSKARKDKVKTNVRCSFLILTNAGLASKGKDVIKMGPRAKLIPFRSSQRNINNRQTSRKRESSGPKQRSDIKSKPRTQN